MSGNAHACASHAEGETTGRPAVARGTGLFQWGLEMTQGSTSALSVPPRPEPTLDDAERWWQEGVNAAAAGAAIAECPYGLFTSAWQWWERGFRLQCAWQAWGRS